MEAARLSLITIWVALGVGLSLPAAFRSKGSWMDDTMPALYALYLLTGQIFGSQPRGLRSKIAPPVYTTPITAGSVIRIVRDRFLRTISFVVNGVPLGVDFTNVIDSDLYAVVEMGNNEDSVTICNPDRCRALPPLQ